MDAFLRIKLPEGDKVVPVLSQPLTIGRHSDNIVTIDETMASRFHCVIESANGNVTLRDLQSLNGTIVNGVRVAQAFLKPGDVIRIGALEMTMVVNNSESQPVSAPAKTASAPKPPPPVRPLVDDSCYDLQPKSEPSREIDFADGVELVEDEVIDDLEVVELEVVEEVAADSLGTLKTLRRAADALLERDFEPNAITLINTRGKPLHDDRGGTGDADLLLRLALLICFRSHATDVHLEPRVSDFLLRIRMDGNLVDMVAMPQDLGIRLTALVKILSDLDTTQKAIVQEGHFACVTPREAGSRRVDYRVSFAPTLHGQKMVVRVFDTAHGPQKLEDLHLPKDVAKAMSDELERDAGLILVCGPTGSGKTTTLYSLLRSCGASFRNIVTIEDPVEVQIEATTQLPVDEANGKGFAALLRSVLRQDPDVIMVGEIRDSETAKIALQAAMTGHLVLSTIHTRDTAGTIFRLLDLGIEPYMVSQGLHLVLAQRLVRTLCAGCKRPQRATDADRRRMGRAGANVEKIYSPVGCPKCLGTGFYNRRAFFEFMATGDRLRDQIMKTPSVVEIQATQGANFIRLAEHGCQLVAQGLTSLDEVERAVGR